MITLYKKIFKYSMMIVAATMLVSAAPALAANKKGSSGAAHRGIVQSIEAALLNRTTSQAKADTPAADQTQTAASDNTGNTPAATANPAPADPATPTTTNTGASNADTPDTTATPPAASAATSTPVPASTPDPTPAVIVSPPTPTAPAPTPVFVTPDPTPAPAPAVVSDPTPEPVAEPATTIAPVVPTTNSKRQNTSKKITAVASSTAAIATSGIGSLLQEGTNAGDVYASTRFTAGETQNLLALAVALFVLGLILTGDKLFKRSLAGITNNLKVGAQPQASRSQA